MPEDSVKPFYALCPECNARVTALPLFTRAQAIEALRSGADLEVMHTADRDHRWMLGKRERDKLRWAISAGEV